MSQNYCIRLKQNLTVMTITTTNPVNFKSLQFSLSVNSLVIFLFSKYPFNFGAGNKMCINRDEFGFAQVGQNFSIDLSNYQGYYMLMLIYPEGINFSDVGWCYVFNNLTMTFQNTTISPIQNGTVTNNFMFCEEYEFCNCYLKSINKVGTHCNNSNYVSIISLDDLNNQLVIMSCQTFVYQNNTTVGFATPNSCLSFGVTIRAQIIFNANQQVIDFLNNNNISYTIIYSDICKASSCMPICLPPIPSSIPLPCKSIYHFSKLLIPPKKYSLISSKLWNEIIQDLYLAYNVYKYIKYLTQFPYLQNIYSIILDFYNFYENFQPYPFIPLIKAKKGLPLTADYFNTLIDAIIHLANLNVIQLQKRMSYVQPDQIVRSLQFDDIVYNVNQLLTFNFHQYFLLSCTGYEFNNLVNLISTFLNVLIANNTVSITIPNNVFIKNFLIYNNITNIYINGQIINFIIYLNQGWLQFQNNASTDSLIIKINNALIQLFNNAYINSINIQIDNVGLALLNNTFINKINIQIENGNIGLSDYANINLLNIKNNNGTITLYDNAYINTLYIENNFGEIYLYDNTVIENLICKQNIGTIYIYGNAKVINNQCA